MPGPEPYYIVKPYCTVKSYYIAEPYYIIKSYYIAESHCITAKPHCIVAKLYYIITKAPCLIGQLEVIGSILIYSILKRLKKGSSY